jgi:hypothetical protein
MKWTQCGGTGKFDERRETYCVSHVDRSVSKVEKLWIIKGTQNNAK